jgi:hypothetical protein
MEGNTERCTQRNLYRSLDENGSRNYEKVEIFQKTNIKERGKTTLLLVHGRDESRTCRTKRKDFKMRVAKAAAMLGDS